MIKCNLRHNIVFTALSILPIMSPAQEMTVFPSDPSSRATMQFYREEYKRVGVYKVKGNSLVLQGNNVTDLYTSKGFGANLPLLFDAYSQDLSILLANKTEVSKLTFDEVDSFIVKLDTDKKYSEPTFFLNAYKVDLSRKMYLQRLSTGPKYSLYKSFFTELRPAATDLAQTHLREFEIVNEFFYLPVEGNEFIKIKKNAKAVKKLFETEKDIIEGLEKSFEQNFEATLVTFFDRLNG